MIMKSDKPYQAHLGRGRCPNKEAGTKMCFSYNILAKYDKIGPPAPRTSTPPRKKLDTALLKRLMLCVGVLDQDLCCICPVWAYVSLVPLFWLAVTACTLLTQMIKMCLVPISPLNGIFSVWGYSIWHRLPNCSLRLALNSIQYATEIEPFGHYMTTELFGNKLPSWTFHWP